MVRRLRDKLRCERPEDVVQFLRENQKIPTIYEDDPKIVAQAVENNFLDTVPQSEMDEEIETLKSLLDKLDIKLQRLGR